MRPEPRNLETLLDFMVRHNKEHIEELKGLTEQARLLRATAFHGELLKGVERMIEANQTLERAPEIMRGQEILGKETG